MIRDNKKKCLNIYAIKIIHQVFEMNTLNICNKIYPQMHLDPSSLDN